jgi:hypothetical protein
MFFAECTLPKTDTNHFQKIIRFFLVSIIIFFFICPDSAATDLSCSKIGIFNVSVAEPSGSTHDFRVPGYFFPVLPEERTIRFFYSAQNSDTALLTGGDLMILPRSTAGSGTQENPIYLKFSGQDSRIVPRGEKKYSGRANFLLSTNS